MTHAAPGRCGAEQTAVNGGLGARGRGYFGEFTVEAGQAFLPRGDTTGKGRVGGDAGGRGLALVVVEDAQGVLRRQGLVVGGLMQFVGHSARQSLSFNRLRRNQLRMVLRGTP